MGKLLNKNIVLASRMEDTRVIINNCAFSFTLEGEGPGMGAEKQWYDYRARYYDPQIGRWHSVDPLAVISLSWNTYTYCQNNPLRLIDLFGMAPIEATDFEKRSA